MTWSALLALFTVAISAYASVPESEAYVRDAQGRISTYKSAEAWALSPGDRVGTQRRINTGIDGFGRFETNDGNSFELYGNTRVLYRQNLGTSADLLDVLSGHARIHVQGSAGHPQRIFTPAATLTPFSPATIALAISGDATVRIDVIEGEVHVQRRMLPRNEATIVKATDSILVDADQPLEHETVCKHTMKRLQDMWTTIFPGHHSEFHVQ